MQARRLPPLALVALFVPAPAAAHIGLQPQSIDLQTPPLAETPLDLESTFAFFPSDDGQTFRFSCHEALLADPSIPTTLVPRYVRTGTRALLVTLLDPGLGFAPGVPVYRSDDGGCGWTPVEGLTGRTITSLAVLPSGAVVAASGSLDGGANGLFRSTDDGATFLPSDAAEVPGFFLSVRAGGGATAWASSADPVGGTATLHRTEDGGASWTAVPFTPLVEDEVPVDLRVLAVDPADDDRVLVVATGSSFDYVFGTTDGATFVERHRDGGTVKDGAFVDGVAWLAVGSARPRAAADGAPFDSRPEAPYAEGLLATPGGLLFAVNALFEDAAVADEAGPRFGFGDVTEELACPPESLHATVCSALWPQAREVLTMFVAGEGDDDDDDATGGDDDDDDCACNASLAAGPPRGAAVLLALVALRRRR